MEALSDIIYHYCDLEAFTSIITNRKIWLSNSLSTNDIMESKWINNNLEKVSKEFKKNRNYKKIITRVLNSYYANPEIPYIACFSEQGDLLSQWRAYANDGKGVAIGFNKKSFNHAGIFDKSEPSGNPIILSPVVYEEQKQIDLIESVFETVFKIFDSGNEENAHQIGHTALKRLSMVCKNPAFSEEKEVRMIYNPYYMNLVANIKNLKEDKNLQNLPIRFRTNEDKVISYFEYEFSINSKEPFIKSIVLGPKNRTSEYELEVIINTFGLGIKNTYRSKASYI